VSGGSPSAGAAFIGLAVVYALTMARGRLDWVLVISGPLVAAHTGVERPRRASPQHRDFTLDVDANPAWLVARRC
jgi:hypothetical protein